MIEARRSVSWRLFWALTLLAVLSGWGAWNVDRVMAAPAADEGWLPFGAEAGPATPELTLVRADAGVLELVAELPGGTVETVRTAGRTFTRLDGEGYGHFAPVGYPDLPVLRQEVEIPWGATVQVEVLDSQTTETALQDRQLYPIYPVQPPAVKLPGPVPPLSFDSDFYAQDGFYPEAPVVVGEPYVVRGHRIVPVEVRPVAYDPATGKLRLYSQIRFQLRLTGSDERLTRATAARYASPLFDASLSRRVLNYNLGRPLTVAAKETVGYLIITADAYYDALQPFVQLQQTRGFQVTVTKLSQIPATTRDQIKSYINTAYTSWPVPPSYVLLVGDTDTIPAWNSVESSGKYTDLYYFTMDGTSDWHPDLGRGRFPVRSAAQVTAMVNKYLAYYQLNGSEPWLKRASFIATCDNYEVAEATHNYVISTHTQPRGYTGFFPNNPQPGGDKIYCVAHSGTATQIRNAANEGRWAIIYSGHGSETGWADGNVSFSQTDVRNLTENNVQPFVASHACVTGSFNQTECYAETWVLQPNKGALVFWGASHNTYWDEDDVLEKKVFDVLFAAGTHRADVAEMTDTGLAQVETDYSDSARYYWEAYNVMGDPSVKVFLEPETPSFNLAMGAQPQGLCGAGVLTTTVAIESVRNFTGTVELTAGALPAGVTAAFNPAVHTAPFTAVLTLTVAPEAASGDYSIAITATDHISLTKAGSVDIQLANAVPGAPALTAPVPGATGASLKPEFFWGAVPTALQYDFQLARNPLFSSGRLEAGDLLTTTYALQSVLEEGRCYWWQTRASNVCGSGAWAEPNHFATRVLGSIFSDNLESGAAHWSHAAAVGTDHWSITPTQSHSPSHAWFIPDDPTRTDSRLWTTEPITLGGDSMLTFWHKYAFEGTVYDGGVLEISTDGGQNWIDLKPQFTAGGYNGTLGTGYNNPLGGRSAWTGDLTSWTQVAVNLNPYAGQRAQFRWRLGCDSSGKDDGWYIDDIQITAPLPPNAPPAITSFSIGSGQTSQERDVTIVGQGFVGMPAIRLGDTWLISVTLVNSTLLQAVLPAGVDPAGQTLTLYNGDCGMASLSQTPLAGLQATNSGPIVNTGMVTLTATISSGLNVTYDWAFGDGELGSGAVVTHYYALLGSYQAVVTASNSSGAITATTTVVVEGGNAVYLPLVLRPAD